MLYSFSAIRFFNRHVGVQFASFLLLYSRLHNSSSLICTSVVLGNIQYNICESPCRVCSLALHCFFVVCEFAFGRRVAASRMKHMRFCQNNIRNFRVVFRFGAEYIRTR